jgi:broad specificity phosphatase PhoE
VVTNAWCCGFKLTESIDVAARRLKARDVTTVYLIPHTEATHHIERRVGGWYDSDLTERGRTQAQATASALKKIVAEMPVIFSSDLARATQTAQPIADSFGSDFVVTPDLREIGCGIAEGKPQAWLNERISYPPQDQSRIDHKIIEGAETRRTAATRIQRFVNQLIEQAPRQAVVVTHGFASTFVVAAWIGMPIQATAFVDFEVSPGGITTLELDEQWGNRLVSRLNDTTHLSEI